MATYNGDDNDNIYNGTSGDDIIHGYGGNDKLYGGDGNDSIFGDDGNDRLYGGAGNDTLAGGTGADTYIISQNEGHDSIYDPPTSSTSNINIVKFTDVASTEAVKFRFNEGLSLFIDLGGDNFVAIDLFDVNYRLYKFQFSDGVTWDWQAVKQKINQGTNGDDRLWGLRDTNNNLSGLAGNDLLVGSNQNDTFNGGRGNDVILFGGWGRDTYLFAKNDGQDTLDLQWDVTELKDQIRFTDFNLTDITKFNITSGEPGLAIGYGNNSQLTITYQSAFSIHFADGYAASVTLVDAPGTNANDVMLGLGSPLTLSGGAGSDLYLIDDTSDSITEAPNAGKDNVLSSIDFTLPANVENLSLLEGVLVGTGNALNNILSGNNANNILTGLAGNDTLVGKSGKDNLDGGNGNDVLTGGLGKDKIILTETTAATDTVKIAAGDSKVAAYDRVVDFTLGNGTTTTGADKLDLDSTVIASDVAAADGINAGIIQSHAISNGIISFDDADSYAAALTLTAANLNDVFAYLQDNITANATVAFHALGNTYVFQDGGATDTLVQLSGVTASNLNNTGEVVGGVWLA